MNMFINWEKMKPCDQFCYEYTGELNGGVRKASKKTVTVVSASQDKDYNNFSGSICGKMLLDLATIGDGRKFVGLL